MGRKDVITIDKDMIEIEVIPNKWMDDNGDPVYNRTQRGFFKEMKLRHLDQWIREVTSNIRDKWLKAQGS